jgi:peptidoglycan/LPS O-acetylase OafA/YrhL
MVETLIEVAAVSYLLMFVIGALKYVWPQEAGRPRWVTAIVAVVGGLVFAVLVGVQNDVYNTIPMAMAIADTLIVTVIAAGGALVGTLAVGEAAKAVRDRNSPGEEVD